jgi:hypothetical protein
MYIRGMEALAQAPICLVSPDVPVGTNPPPYPLAPVRKTNEPTLDLFARGTDNQLYHRWWKSGIPWTQWQSLRGELASGAGVASHNNGILHLGVLGADNRIHDRSYVNDGMLAGGWSNWKPLGSGEFSSAPSPVSWGTDHFAMYARGSDNRIRQNRYTFGVGWSDWQLLPGDTQTFPSAPAAVAYAPERLHVFAKGTDNRIYERHTLPAGGWSAWAALGTRTFHSGPGAVSWGEQHLEVFAVDLADRKVWHTWYRFGVGWSDWFAFDGAQTFTEAPAAGTHGLEKLNLFALGTDGRIWERYHLGGGQWSPWASTGDRQFTSAPASASWSNR